MELKLMHADILALADIGLPGGRSGLALLRELPGEGQGATIAKSLEMAEPSEWLGAALDIGGFLPPHFRPTIRT